MMETYCLMVIGGFENIGGIILAPKQSATGLNTTEEAGDKPSTYFSIVHCGDSPNFIQNASLISLKEKNNVDKLFFCWLCKQIQRKICCCYFNAAVRTVQPRPRSTATGLSNEASFPVLFVFRDSVKAVTNFH